MRHAARSPRVTPLNPRAPACRFPFTLRPPPSALRASSARPTRAVTAARPSPQRLRLHRCARPALRLPRERLRASFHDQHGRGNHRVRLGSELNSVPSSDPNSDIERWRRTYHEERSQKTCFPLTPSQYARTFRPTPSARHAAQPWRLAGGTLTPVWNGGVGEKRSRN
jgi:hypothetical protein